MLSMRLLRQRNTRDMDRTITAFELLRGDVNFLLHVFHGVLTPSSDFWTRGDFSKTFDQPELSCDNLVDYDDGIHFRRFFKVF